VFVVVVIVNCISYVFDFLNPVFKNKDNDSSRPEPRRAENLRRTHGNIHTKHTREMGLGQDQCHSILGIHTIYSLCFSQKKNLLPL